MIKCSVCQTLSSSLCLADAPPFWAEINEDETPETFLERLTRWTPFAVYNVKLVRLFAADSRNGITAENQIKNGESILKKRNDKKSTQIYVVFTNADFDNSIHIYNSPIIIRSSLHIDN